MFKGNPREPGSLSFENIRFLLDEKRMSQLRENSQDPNPMQHPQPEPQQPAEKANNEWIVSHLSSYDVTGLRHEIDVLCSLNILSIEACGKLVLAQGWERRVPHMILDEMKDEWGTGMDVHNLYCIHERIKSSLEMHWQYIEDEGWQNVDNAEDNKLFEDEEYQLRKQIFVENYTDWVSEKSGMGEFGV